MRDLILNSTCLVSFLDENVIEATLSLNLISISKENKLEGQYAQSKGGGDYYKYRFKLYKWCNPSSIYSWFLKPFSVLHSRFPTKKSWMVAVFDSKTKYSTKIEKFIFAHENMKKPSPKVAYLSRNSVGSEFFLLLPNSSNGRIHVPICGL